MRLAYKLIRRRAKTIAISFVVMRWFLLILSLVATANSLKFLVYATQYAKSHSNFLARLSDILIDEGHEVVREKWYFHLFF